MRIGWGVASPVDKGTKWVENLSHQVGGTSGESRGIPAKLLHSFVCFYGKSVVKTSCHDYWSLLLLGFTSKRTAHGLTLIPEHQVPGFLES